MTGLNPKGVLSPGKYRTPVLLAVMEPRKFFHATLPLESNDTRFCLAKGFPQVCSSAGSYAQCNVERHFLSLSPFL